LETQPVGRGLDLHVDAEMMSPQQQQQQQQHQQQQQQQQLFMKSVLSVSDVKRSETEQHKQDLLRRKKLEGRILEAVSISPKVERSEREIGNAG
jgi:hypothetical protein